MGWRVGQVSGGVLDLFWEEEMDTAEGSFKWDGELDLSLVVCWTCFGWGTFIFNSFKRDGELDLYMVVCWTCIGCGTFIFNSFKWDGELDWFLVVCWTYLKKRKWIRQGE